MIFERAEGRRPIRRFISAMDDDGMPIGWGALSGLVADPERAGNLYAVTDSVFGGQPRSSPSTRPQTPALDHRATARHA